MVKHHGPLGLPIKGANTMHRLLIHELQPLMGHCDEALVKFVDSEPEVRS